MVIPASVGVSSRDRMAHPVSETTPSVLAYRFGPFEADLRRSELRKFGMRIRLERKPWQLLLALLERPGELVTRAELERRLWGEGVFVDFEHGVNVAVKKVRDALCDSAETRRYIETVAGGGYRFIAPVEVVTGPAYTLAPVAPPAQPAAAAPVRTTDLALAEAALRNRQHWAIALTAGAALTILFVAIMAARLPSRTPPLVHPAAERVTGSAEEQAVGVAAISPDGRYLAYSAGPGIWLKQLATGDIHPLATEPKLVPFDMSWYGDSANLLVVDKQGVWRVSIVGGGAERIYGPAGFAGVSRDGTQLAITTIDRRSVWVADSGGEHGHVVAALPDGTPGYYSPPVWSPHGKRLAFMKHWAEGGIDKADIETVRPDGTNASVVLQRFPIKVLLWLNDGRIAYGVAKPPSGTSNLWTVPVDEDTGHADSFGEPLTDWPNFDFLRPTATNDSHTIAFVRRMPRTDVFTADLSDGGTKLGRLSQTSFGTSFSYTYPGTWDEDGQSLFVSATGDFQHVILRQPLDGSPARPVVPVTQGHQSSPQLSPDGHWLLWIREPRGDNSKEPDLAEVLRMPREGGPAEALDQQSGVAFGLRCPTTPGAACVFMSQSLNETVFRAIDPDLRTSRELFRWKSPKDAFEFDVSPDGTKMVVREPGEGGKVFVVDLPGGGNRRELSSSEPNLGSWRWLPDGKGWLVTRIVLPRGCEVLRVDESGATTVLWKSDSERLGDPEISRDGRHVAFAKYSSESNAWILRF